MIKISQKQQKIIGIFLERGVISSSDAHDAILKMGEDFSLVTIKRTLSEMVSEKLLEIEGNTYTLLDTEKLILENKEAPGHDKKEAQMILNHKDAFNFIHENKSHFKILTRKNLEELHALLVKDLSVGLGLRSKPVGVTGSIYKPLDNIHQISEAVSKFSAAVDRTQTPFARA